MNEEMTALARRVIACRGWRWMRGMSNDQGQTIDCVDLILGKAYCGEWDADMTALPDLTDPATLGCLLALVREAWGDKMMQPQYFKGEARWCLCSAGESVLVCGRYLWGDTEAEALVAALEAAPCGQ